MPALLGKRPQRSSPARGVLLVWETVPLWVTYSLGGETDETERRPVRSGADEGVRVHLADLSEFCCPSCEEEFTIKEIRDLVEGWGKILAWVDLAPEYPEDEE